MLLPYLLTLACLSSIAIYQYRLTEATLYWGKLCASLAPVDPGSPRGYQDDLTPPIHTTIFILRILASIGVYVWGFFVMPWWIAFWLPFPILVAEHFLKQSLPEPQSEYFKSLLIKSLERRERQYTSDGDHFKAMAAQLRLELLRKAAQGAPITH